MKKKKRIMSLAMVLLLVAMLPITAFAQEYNIDDGDIQVTAKSDGKQYVTQTAKGYTDVEQTTPTVIKQNNSSTPKRNTITINAEAGKTAKVTLDGVNIDVSSDSKAAVSTTGKGDVTIELDGNNTIKSGVDHAGLEKNNAGKLTINDADNNGSLNATGGESSAGIGGKRGGYIRDITITGGEVTATGGLNGAGIGGGAEGAGSYITISGGKIIATGGENGAGIGGGQKRDGSYIVITGGEVIATGGEVGAGIGGGRSGGGCNITISGGKVVATGGDYGAGIGGGISGTGSNITIYGGKVVARGGFAGAGIGGGKQGNGSNITLSGGEIAATGGLCGAGIGGGNHSSAQNNKDIKVSGNTHLKVQAGVGNTETQGAAIGSGGYDNNRVIKDTAEIMPDVNGLAATGYILYYDQGVDMNDANAKAIAVIRHGNTGKHVCTTTVTPAVEATCTTDGSTIGLKCTCGEIEVEPQTVKATGHIWENGKCSVCGTPKPGTTPDSIDTDAKPVKTAVGTTSPQTADNSNIVLWMILLLASGGAGIGSVALARRKTSDAE